MIEILFPVLFMIMGIVIPYLVFTKYLHHVEKHHNGLSDEESLEEATVFGLGFMSIAFFPIGLIALLQLI
ncbi:membrane protein [Staphylococcus phage Quidividi]|nr:membrane protein [Staphylococcus phage Quidividi]